MQALKSPSGKIGVKSQPIKLSMYNFDVKQLVVLSVFDAGITTQSQCNFFLRLAQIGAL